VDKAIALSLGLLDRVTKCPLACFDFPFCACQIRQRVSSLLQEAKTQAALVLDSLETRQE
jgi:hypothetical protein